MMTPNARFISLQSQKRELENQIDNEVSHPAYNPFRVAELKKRKLMISDEMRRLSHAA